MVTLKVEIIGLQQGEAIVRWLPPPGCEGCQRQVTNGAFCSSQGDVANKGLLHLPAPTQARIGQQWQLRFNSAPIVRVVLAVYLGPLALLLFSALLLEQRAFSESGVAVGALLAASSGAICLALNYHKQLAANSVQVEWQAIGCPGTPSVAYEKRPQRLIMPETLEHR